MTERMTIPQSSLVIGVDSGVQTGFAVWDTDKMQFTHVLSLPIHRAVIEVLTLKPAFVIVEDARKMQLFIRADQKNLKHGAGVREGIGSIKRDAKIWEDLLSDFKIPHRMVKPGSFGQTKLKDTEFRRRTGWQKPTNEHARDAAMMVHGLSAMKVMRMIEEWEVVP